MSHNCCATVLAILLLLIGLLPYSSGIPVRPYQTALSDEERQEIANLAAKILRSTIAGSYLGPDKRNAGTIDSLYNLPHLFAAGKR